MGMIGNRILAVVAATVVAASCGAGAPDAAPPRSAPVSAATSGSAPEAEPPISAAFALLPASASGWTRDGEPARYGPGDLWEYINGAAEQYLSYGFQELVTAKYTHASGLAASVDVYRMAGRSGAFGIHAQEASPKAEAVRLGVEGRAGSDSVRFWSGAYYVKLSVSPPPAKPSRAEAMALAQAIGDGLGAPGGMSEELALFPPAGLMAGSVSFVPADILGQSRFANGFEAKYGIGGTPSTLVIVPFKDAESAAAALAGYQSFLGQSGTLPKGLASPGDGGFVGHDGYYGRIVAIRAGTWLSISLGAGDDASATALLSAASDRLAKAAASRKAGER